eukprot:15436058-Alexandrium_andersonii.AAC.1
MVATPDGEYLGRPPRGTTWDLGGEDPADVAEEAGGYLAVPNAKTQEWWGSLMDNGPRDS